MTSPPERPSEVPAPGAGAGSGAAWDVGLLDDLNPAQQEAVTHQGSPLLVVAGAGTGKTRVLTRRVAWLVAGGMPAHAVLAITFTNKAADELRRRLASLPGGAGCWAGTFHGFGAWLLRRHGEAIGIDPNFTILDRDDQRTLLRTLIKDLDFDPAVVRPADAGPFISNRKNGAAVDIPFGLAADFETVFDAYVERLRNASLLDFDDLLLEAKRLLAESAETAAIYRRRFAHILVDEYQDTNVIQRDLLRLLVGEPAALTVVGDPDQSIYRWRGAAIGNILDFPEHFPGARTVLLERNYRSTANILAAAEAVIERNEERHAKTLESTRETGSVVRTMRCRDAGDEGRIVAAQVKAWRDAGRRLDDIAVFYRVNALSRGIELGLNEADVPYVIVAGTEFFQRREVKDVLAYARLVENPRDDAAFLRVVNVPRRGIGAASLRKLRVFAQSHGLTYFEAASRCGEAGIRGKASKGLAGFVALHAKVRAMPRAPIAPILEALVEGSGYRAALEDHPDTLERSRVDNVDELVAYAREYAKKVPEGDLQAFLERTSLVSDQDGYDRGTGAVSLMSVHAAKGLEFPCVVIVGVEDGYFPHARNAHDPSAVEEERRLFYVAMTRAQDALVITYTAGRTTYMGAERRNPSAYLADIPDAVVKHEDIAGAGLFGAPSFGERPKFHESFGTDTFEAVDPPAPDGASFIEDAGGDDIPVVRENESGFAVGERVRHAYFGAGELAEVGGRGEETRLTVDFDDFGRKQFLLRYAQLEKIQ